MLTVALIMVGGYTMKVDVLGNVILGLCTALGLFVGANVTNSWAALKSGTGGGRRGRLPG